MFSSVASRSAGTSDLPHYGLSAAALPSAAVARRPHQV